jgi:hypothetical protein
VNKLISKIVVFLLIAIPLKWLGEDALQRSREDLKLENVGLAIELRSKLGQNLAIALLSGFRGIVADLVWLKAHGAWEEQRWYKMKEGIELTVVLQPHSISFWDIGAWHMAWNASYGESVNMKYPSEAYRKKTQKDWILAGKKFLEQGIRNNPNAYDLYFKLGWLIYQKLEDPLAAVPYLRQASTYPDAPLYVVRMVGRMYEKGEKKQEEYEWWKQLWMEHLRDPKANPQQLWYKIEQWGAEAEETLKIPNAERVFPSKTKSRTVKSSK